MSKISPKHPLWHTLWQHGPWARTCSLLLGVRVGDFSLNIYIFFSGSLDPNGVPFQKWPFVNQGALPSPYLLMEGLAISLKPSMRWFVEGKADGFHSHPFPASDGAGEKDLPLFFFVLFCFLSFASFSSLENREPVRFVLGAILLPREDDSRPKIMEA